MSQTPTDHLVALAANKATTYILDKPCPNLLESFPSPFADKLQNPWQAFGMVHIECPEFTSLCPLTGQPDFATIVIDYTPDELCVESKALKLYLMSFRNHGEFHEACVTRILNDLVTLLEPKTMTIQGKFTPRGGIPFWPTVRYIKTQ
jgi:7-cyano-7-deazaguanine reductase